MGSQKNNLRSPKKMYRKYGDENTNWSEKGANTILKREPIMNLEQKWEYEDGLMLNGMYEIYKVTGQKTFLDYIQYNMDLLVDDLGRILDYHPEEFNIDHINNGKALLDLFEETKDERYKTAAETLYKQLLSQPKTTEGTFWHKKIYPYQVWLDGLYMGSVFYARYQKLFNLTENLKDVVHQFLNAYQVTYDEKTGLCYHAYDEKRVQLWADKNTGHSPHFWTRGLGWFVMAMVDVLEYLPDEIEGKSQMKENLISLLISLQNYADQKTNLWYQVVDQGERPGNYLESSGSLMILNAIAKSIRKGYISSEKWQPILEKGYKNAIEQFITVTNEGYVNVNKICQVAGLGGKDKRDGSFAYYISEPIVTNDHKGVGPFLLLSAEMIRNKQLV